MKRITVLLFTSIIIFSCSPKNYEYVFEMNKPKNSNELKFSDDKINISFVVNNSDVTFNLKNNTGRPLKIIWDEASFVKNGAAQKILHKNVKFVDKEKNQAPTVIPPNSYIEDLIQPIDDIELNTSKYGNRTQTFWSNKPFFPNYNYNNGGKKYVNDKIKSLKGTIFNIYLPVQYDGKTLEYYFELEVTDILLRKNRKDIKSIF